jgi:hypothetical protein
MVRLTQATCNLICPTGDQGLRCPAHHLALQGPPVAFRGRERQGLHNRCVSDGLMLVEVNVCDR